MAENILVRQDKFACPQNSSAISECSLKKPHTTQDREKLQNGDKESVGRSRTFLVRAAVPGMNHSASVPSINRSASVPGINRSASVPGTNQFRSVAGTNQSESVPGTNQFRSVAGTNQSESVPRTNQFRSVAGTNQSESVPRTNPFRSVPGTNQSESAPCNNPFRSIPSTNKSESAPCTNPFRSVPGTYQSESAPCTNPFRSEPGTNQSESTPCTNPFRSVPGTNQPESAPCTNPFRLVPGTNQSESVPCTNHYTSIAGSNNSTSLPNHTTSQPNHTTSLQNTDQLKSVPDNTSLPVIVNKRYALENPDNCANLNIYSTDDLYDDVYLPSAVCSGGTSSDHPFRVVEPQDDDIYREIHPTTDEEEQCTRKPATLRTSDDVASVRKCYGSIYSGGDSLMTADGRGSLDSATVRTGGSSSASSSIGNHSCCDQSNSLYGVGGSRFDLTSVCQTSTDGLGQLADFSGGDSPLKADGPQNSGVVKSRFADEPLYQVYAAAVVERDMGSELDSHIYEEIGDVYCMLKFSRPTAMELIQPRECQQRTLWCEIPEVLNSGVLGTINQHQKKLQETKFEIITSEASYINSLNVLEKHFMSNLELCDESALSKNDRRILFANVTPVKTCSEQFLAELEECWQDNLLLNGICDVVYKHASNNFNGYVKYCSNLFCLDRTLRGLKEHNKMFAAFLQQLEKDPLCQSLHLQSFLMLPMQHITRLPLLLDAVLTCLDQTDDEYRTCQLALTTLKKIVKNCNEEARRMERVEEILILSQQLYFPNEVKAVPIISSTRWLVRKGELTCLTWRGDDSKLILRKKSKIQIHVFLFSDLLVIAKKKKRKSAPDATGDESYAVIDYCPRNLVQMTSIEGMTNLSFKIVSDGRRNLVLLKMLQDHEKKAVEMVLSCSTESDRKRWLEAVSLPTSDNRDKTVFEEQSCTQVMTVQPPVVCQPDDMSLEATNVLKLHRKMNENTRIQLADLSGGDSLVTEDSLECSRVVTRWFADEPLYQVYTADVVKREMRRELGSDCYKEIGDVFCKPKSPGPSAMELIQPSEGQHRTLWCEIPEVLNSGFLDTISPHQKKLQEAKFEIITSEASYINSLNVLEKHFMSSLEMCDESVLSKNDRRILFSNVIPVKTCSEQFLAELVECWQDNILLLNGICEVVYKHASKNFNGYVKYCSNLNCLNRTLCGLKEENMKFAEVLQQLESNPECQSLSVHSFLMLPMQRITRLPLLIDAVLTRLNQTDDEYSTCQLALATLNKIVQNCNEEARRMERADEILILSQQFYFTNDCKSFPILSSTRWLVRKGELTQLVRGGEDGKWMLWKKSRIQIHLFLFSDLLVIAKKKRKSAADTTDDESYAVMDYCPRNLVQMTSTEGMKNLPVKVTSDCRRNLVLLTMLQNHEKKPVEMVLSCSTESDRHRWLEVVSPPVSDNPDETIYEEWDCPQVVAIHRYVACQPDELSLEVVDVVNVLRKMSDGWYEGVRIRDGERGWFPGNHTKEVESAHVRARNLKQCYRLFALSGNFLEAQRKAKKAK